MFPFSKQKPKSKSKSKRLEDLLITVKEVRPGVWRNPRTPKSLYKLFHHMDANKVQEIEFSPPKELIKIGEIKAIEYVCSNPSKFSNETYRHVFKRKTVLATDGKNLYVFGIKITKRGIEDK